MRTSWDNFLEDYRKQVKIEDKTIREILEAFYYWLCKERVI